MRTFVVLNKADQLSEADLREAEAFTAQVVDKATGVRAELFTCSVRRGRSDPGYARFAVAMGSYLGQRAEGDMVLACVGTWPAWPGDARCGGAHRAEPAAVRELLSRARHAVR